MWVKDIVKKQKHKDQRTWQNPTYHMENFGEFRNNGRPVPNNAHIQTGCYDNSPQKRANAREYCQGTLELTKHDATLGESMRLDCTHIPDNAEEIT